MQRTERYADWVDLQTTAHIIGVGAVGRQVALQLAAMGISTLCLYDFDQVDETNLGTQGFSPDQIYHFKVEATKKDCLMKNPYITIETRSTKFEKLVFFPGRQIVFLCVDSMAARAECVKALIAQGYRGLLIDTRLSQTTLLCLSGKLMKHQGYWAYWYPEEQRARCTAETTIYMANITAGIAIDRFVQHFQGILPNEWTMIKLDTFQLRTVTPEELK